MPLPLPEGKKIHITYVKTEENFEMPSLEAAEDHYGLGYIAHGDRIIITPTMQCVLHAGYVGTIAPYLYHKTLPGSNDYYERILIKFAPDYVKSLTEYFGPQIMDQIFSYPTKHFPAGITERVDFLFRSMYEEYNRSHTEYSQYRLGCMLYELLLTIVEYHCNDEEAQIHNTPLSKPMIDALFYMENNYMNPIKIEEVAKISGYSTAYFSRLFQAQLNIPFSEYLNNIRLKHVKSLLISTDKSITDIALETGFRYPGNMTTLFKKVYGMTPNGFRKG